MQELVFNKFNNSYTLKHRNMLDFQTIKKPMIDIKTDSYDVEDIGNLTNVKIKCLFGLMTIDTIVLTADKKDAPLFSFDYVKVGKKETLLLELYNTTIDTMDLSALSKIKHKYDYLTDGESKPQWYDDILLEPSLKKVEKNKHDRFEMLAGEYADAYIMLLNDAKECSVLEKTKKNKAYADGLLTHGGPSTNFLKKILGEEKTKEYFHKYFFGLER